MQSPNAAIEWAALLHIRQMPGSDLGAETGGLD
jgi:hypothetical protein